MFIKEKYLNSLNLFIFGLFVVEFLLGKTHSLTVDRSGEEERLLLQAFIQAGLLFIAYLLLFARRSISKAPFSVRAKDRYIFLTLGVWLAISIGSAIMGFSEGYELRFILGDLYKRSLLPLFFLLFYFSIRSTQELDFILTGIVVTYAAAISYHLFLYVVYLPIRSWTPTVKYIPLLIPIFAYKLWTTNNKLLRCICWLALIEIPFVMAFAQSLAVFLTLPILLVTGLIFRTKWLTRPMVTALLPATIAGLVMLAAVGRFFPQKAGDERRSIMVKFEYMTTDASFIDKLDAITSGGALEPLIFLDKFSEQRGKILTGFGMGYTYIRSIGRVSAILDRRPWKEEDHYITSPYIALFVRSGIFCLVGFLYFLMLFWKRARIYRKRYAFGDLTCVFWLTLTLYYSMNLPLHYPFLLLSLLFVGIITIDKEIYADAIASYQNAEIFHPEKGVPIPHG
jgi:hypothetical protein